LEAFGLGRLDALAQEDVEQHVAGCDRCCDVLRSVGDDTLLERLRAGATISSTRNTSVVTEAFEPALRPTEDESAPRVPDELADHPRYRIVRLLGMGGMGVVYQAEHRLMERPVALKVIHRRLMDNPMAVQRFRLEVKNAARLNHPAIVTAHDAEQAGDLHFLVMEYVDGVSVAQQIARRGALRVDHAAKFIRQAALGLQHAHEKGMVHRDIKPQNLMLARSGRNVQVKILDFGLARFASEQGPQTIAGAEEHATGGGLTMTGVTLGTPDYMAPEQIADARAADIRSDIYSLGCTFYFMLTGQPPFVQGSTVDKLLAHIKSNPQPIAELRRDAPPEVAAILERMMAKDPADRFQSPSDVAQALAPFCKTGVAMLPEQSPSLAVVSPIAGGAAREVRGVAARTAFEEARGAGAGTLFEEARHIGDAGSGPVDLSEIDLEELPDLLPPLPTDFSASSPRRPATPRPGPLDVARSFVKRNRGAVTAIGAAALAALVCVLLYPVIRAAIPSKGSKGTAQQYPKISSLGNSLGSSSSSGSAFDAAEEYSPQPSSGFQPASGPRTGRILLVIPHQNFWYSDYSRLAEALDYFGLDYAVASSSLDRALPALDNRPNSQPVNPDLLVENANPADYDAVIFCGGVPAGEMEFLVNPQQRAAAKTLMTGMLAQGKLVAGICAGNAIVADAGLLRGKPVAANRWIPEYVIEQSGAEWDWETPVAVADRILTGRNELAAKQLVTAIYDRLQR
jgi:serine/threonine protein kinase/putative intracellular protease/amidase